MEIFAQQRDDLESHDPVEVGLRLRPHEPRMADLGVFSQKIDKPQIEAFQNRRKIKRTVIKFDSRELRCVDVTP